MGIDAAVGQGIRGKVSVFSLLFQALARGGNWQTRYFEVVVPQGVQVQVLLSAPVFLRKMGIRVLLTQPGHKNRLNRQKKAKFSSTINTVAEP